MKQNYISQQTHKYDTNIETPHFQHNTFLKIPVSPKINLLLFQIPALYGCSSKRTEYEPYHKNFHKDKRASFSELAFFVSSK